MAGLNKVMIIGNLGRDPEVTYTQSGVAVAKLNVATTENWYDKSSGEKRERTEWHRITFFGKQAETVGRYMSKGSQIYVEGKIQTTQYEKDGSTRYSTEILANTFQFLGGRNSENTQPQQNNGGFQQPQNNGGGFQQAPPQQQGGFQQQQQGGFQQPQNDFGQADQQGFQGPPDDDIPF